MTYVGQGLVNTLLITLIAAVLGLVLGFIVAVVKIAAEHNKWMKIPAAICNVYTTIFRGTPVALQLFIMVFAIFAIPGFKPYAAILTFGINSGAYECEIVRSGIQSIGKGQLEGAMSLGFSKWESMVRIIIPQAIKNILPVIGNEFVTLIKESSQVSVIGMADLMYTATTIQGISFQPFPPLVIVAVYYFILTFAVSNVLRALEWKFKIKAVR